MFSSRNSGIGAMVCVALTGLAARISSASAAWSEMDASYLSHTNNPPMPPHMAQEPMLKKTVGYGDLWDGFGESFGMQGQLETPPSDPLPSPGALPLLAAAALLTGRRRRASLRPGFIR